RRRRHAGQRRLGCRSSGQLPRMAPRVGLGTALGQSLASQCVRFCAMFEMDATRVAARGLPRVHATSAGRGRYFTCSSTLKTRVGAPMTSAPPVRPGRTAAALKVQDPPGLENETEAICAFLRQHWSVNVANGALRPMVRYVL